MTLPVICLMGPTASGKTGLSIELAQALNGEIVSVDSALIYRQMNIGTAKPDLHERAGVPHHLIDILDPVESYSAQDFRDDALALIDTIRQRGRTPILVGGTMLYFRILLSPMAHLPPADPNLRAELDAQFRTQGPTALHGELQRLDSEAAAAIHPHNRQRLIRAVEVCRLTGQPMTALWRRDQVLPAAGTVSNDFPGPTIQLAVAPRERKTLHGRIEKRFDRMLASGFEDEVRALYERGDLTAEHASMRCVGYRQMWDYLSGHLPWSAMRERGIIATRQLAKRQLTWLRGWRNVEHFDTLAPDLARQVLEAIRRS
ncbi:MAG: tRNA (adenosine(37)-N6)-dimethylallyltransferase MiaA [Natronospirillum sp.]|uniref:tRNA (adenosine(37)-N6)-dimethylallyltransferase MiaA n=1 Tax=Natronospirillum sp. TaxID=2812955 RepID=UPI0025D1CDB3|nr:tRNA (adenosine(37)-N6)-dimethylallyltransferase MiaA [Natronospirillum sp.]MCH8550706.1 tRNA (adenosine(37)-N6)-dimethylallyltransferase MiaA [Natronospirillum sp.]